MFLLEYPRLAVGYFGNLFQRPPLLMAFWLITILIHCPIQLLLLFVGGAKRIPIEAVMDCIILIFLIIESVAGFMAVRKSIFKVMLRVKKDQKGEEFMSND